MYYTNSTSILGKMEVKVGLCSLVKRVQLAHTEMPLQSQNKRIIISVTFIYPMNVL